MYHPIESYSSLRFIFVPPLILHAPVLIEKILRTNPDVGKIYVLIKAKDSEAALRRLQNEVWR